MTSRTYGTYTLTETERGPSWSLLLEPSVRMRARRVFGKVQLTKSMEITIHDTNETCRDIAWFMERYPLEAANEFSRIRLEQGTAEHVAREVAIREVLANGREPLDLDVVPSKTPRDYQIKAVEMLRVSRRMLLTDDVGLGKTFTALLAAAQKSARPALIVPPTHLPQRWADEAAEAFPDLQFVVAKKSEPTSELKHGVPDLLVVPYSKIIGWAGYLTGKVRTVIFDEVQDLRHGIGTEKGKSAAMLCAEADYVLGLSATPIYNYGGEIWNIYDIVAPDQLGSREEFGREWGSGTLSGGRMLVADPKALGDHLREAGLMLGRTRAETGSELPLTIKTGMLVESGHEALDAVRDSMEVLARAILDTSTAQSDRFQAAGQIDMQLRKATGVDKAPFVAAFVRLLLESEERVIIWGWHRDVYDIWLRDLATYNPVMYTGTESPKQKAAAIAAFTKPLRREVTIPAPEGDDEPETMIVDDDTASRVLLMSLRSGAGVDGLQKACRVGVFGELDWSPQVHEQAIGRLRRDGMGAEPAVAYFLYSAVGSDPVLLDVLQIKRQQAEPMLSPDGKLAANATYDPHRGRRLAQQVLGIEEEIGNILNDETPEGDA